MNNYNDLILQYQSGEMTISEREKFNRDFLFNIDLRKEFSFQEKLDKVMKKNLFLESIESDSDLIKAEILAQKDIDNYLRKGGILNSKKVSETFQVETEVEIRKIIAKAEVEMVLSGIDDISEEWVIDFEKRKPLLHRDIAARQIVDYIGKSEIFNQKVIQMPNNSHSITRKVIFQAVAAVFILSLLLFKALIPTYSGDSVYKNNYQPLEANSYQLRGSTQDVVTSKLQEGVSYYLSKEYDKAELAFDNLRKMNKNMPELLLFSGLNQMGQNNFSAAIKTFSDLISHEDQFVPEAQWYLGLCYIKTGDLVKARTLLATLSETEGFYKGKAQLILKNLKR